MTEISRAGRSALRAAPPRPAPAAPPLRSPPPPVWLAVLCALLLAALPRPARAQAAAPELDARDGHQRRLPGYAASTGLDALPWAPPSPRRPQGTLLIGHVGDGLRPRLVEWDLEAGAAVRTATQPSWGKARLVSLARRGQGAAAALSGEGQGRLLLLSPSLRATRSVPLGPARSAVVAASDDLFFTAWLDPDGRKLTLARFDAERGRELDRRVVQLSHERRPSDGLPLGDLRVIGGRLWLLTPGPGPLLLSASLDLQTMTWSEDAGPESTLLSWGDQPALLRHDGGSLMLLQLAPDFAITRRRDLGAPGPVTPLGAFEAGQGLALGDGRIFDASWAERRAMSPPFWPARVFWAHRRAVELAVNDKVTSAYVLWTE